MQTAGSINQQNTYIMLDHLKDLVYRKVFSRFEPSVLATPGHWWAILAVRLELKQRVVDAVE
jgi:hypothetical protein